MMTKKEMWQWYRNAMVIIRQKAPVAANAVFKRGASCNLISGTH